MRHKYTFPLRNLLVGISLPLLLLQACSLPFTDPSDSFLNGEGAQRERIEAAVLRVSESKELDQRYRRNIRIVAVNGELRGVLQNKVALRQGRHAITVILETKVKSTDNPDLTNLANVKATLSFDAEPGELYELHGVAEEDEVWLWIARERDSLVVAGARPTN